MKHSMLRGLITNVNLGVYSDGFQFGLTLNVNGLLLSGKLISEEEFYADDQNILFQDFYNGIKSLRAEEGSKYEIEDIGNANILYLKDASYYTGSQKIPSNDGTTMAVVVDDISSYNLGYLGDKPTSN